MRAVGFGEPADSTAHKNVNSSNIKSIVTLSALSADLSKLKTPKLPFDLIETVKCKRQEIEFEIVALEGAPSVSAAVRDIRLHHTVSEVRTGVETVLSIVRNVLNDPKDIKMQRVKISNAAFQRNLGRLRGSELLMHAIGFIGERVWGPGQGTGQGFDILIDGSDNSVYVLKSVIDDQSGEQQSLFKQN